MANVVNLTDVKISGSNIGKERTGYKVPFDPALAIIAAIIVEDTAIPTLPTKKVIKKSIRFLMMNSENSAEYSNVITMFIMKTRIKLNNSLPVKTVVGDATSRKVNVVPRSSSLTNALESPDIAVKKTTTQNKPPVNSGDIFSFPIENKITLIATIMNIASEFIA